MLESSPLGVGYLLYDSSALRILNALAFPPIDQSA